MLLSALVLQLADVGVRVTDAVGERAQALAEGPGPAVPPGLLAFGNRFVRLSRATLKLVLLAEWLDEGNRPLRRQDAPRHAAAAVSALAAQGMALERMAAAKEAADGKTPEGDGANAHEGDGAGDAADGKGDDGKRDGGRQSAQARWRAAVRREFARRPFEQILADIGDEVSKGAKVLGHTQEIERVQTLLRRIGAALAAMPPPPAEAESATDATAPPAAPPAAAAARDAAAQSEGASFSG